MRAPAEESGPKVIKPRMTLGFPVCIRRGIPAKKQRSKVKFHIQEGRGTATVLLILVQGRGATAVQ